ncbi:MAG: type IV pilus assembly protein PilM [Patescibacteria group bacterium]
MSLFGKKNESVIGVDVGTSSIKLVELEKKSDNSVSLVTYGFVEHATRDVRGIGKEDAPTVAQTIKLICEKAGTRSFSATAALPTYVVFTSLISLPPMTKDELDSAIHWEAKKIIPLPLEDIILDYKILSQGKKQPAGLPFAKKEEPPNPDAEPPDYKILITGAAKETVQVYTDIFQKSGLSLTSLETEMFALARALVGEEPGEVMIVEVGAAVTDIIIVQDGVPFLGRSIETGGNALTRAIMNSLHINEKRAEQLKRDIGVTLPSGSAPTGGGGVPAILRETLEPIIHEIRYTLNLYKAHSVTPSPTATGIVEKIILTGGSALLPNLAATLSQSLDMRVILGDPWAHISYPADLKPVLQALGPKFSVAIGLAMRGA